MDDLNVLKQEYSPELTAIIRAPNARVVKWSYWIYLSIVVIPGCFIAMIYNSYDLRESMVIHYKKDRCFGEMSVSGADKIHIRTGQRVFVSIKGGGNKKIILQGRIDYVSDSAIGDGFKVRAYFDNGAQENSFAQSGYAKAEVQGGYAKAEVQGGYAKAEVQGGYAKAEAEAAIEVSENLILKKLRQAVF